MDKEHTDGPAGHRTDRQSSSPVCALSFDPEQARDVARWRTAERIRLRSERMALSVVARTEWAAALMSHLAALVGSPKGKVVSGYWPIKGEADLRPWLASLHQNGVAVALPVVVERGAPLQFRLWTPGMAMERGNWNIPVPPATAPVLYPDVALAPLVGWDRAGFRLGYGGGYFDRTLASLSPRPTVLGVGLQAAELKTIFPQDHDIPMTTIITENGPQT